MRGPSGRVEPVSAGWCSLRCGVLLDLQGIFENAADGLGRRHGVMPKAFIVWWLCPAAYTQTLAPLHT